MRLIIMHDMLFNHFFGQYFYIKKLIFYIWQFIPYRFGSTA